MVVGDGRPFIGALITLDPEAFGPWKARHGKPADATVASLRDDPDLLADVQAAVDDANLAVSHAESIRHSASCPSTSPDEPASSRERWQAQEVLAEKFADDIDAMYS